MAFIVPKILEYSAARRPLTLRRTLYVIVNGNPFGESGTVSSFVLEGACQGDLRSRVLRRNGVEITLLSLLTDCVGRSSESWGRQRV